MPAHIFVLNRKNYEVCIQRGIVGLPEARVGSKHEESISDALLSRLAIVNEGDYVLFYLTKEKDKTEGGKELWGVWKAVGQSFFDESPVWEDRIYPFRHRIESTIYSFKKPLRLHDIYDLRNSGKIWTWAPTRASGTNAMFSISNLEFGILLQEYLKINPFTIDKNIIMEPYPVKSANLFEKLHRSENDRLPRFEASLMAWLMRDFARRKHQDVFGNYADYLSYVPTNFGTEIDILLLFSNPQDDRQIMSYDIIEVKLDRFSGEALRQLIGYESWFIHKKVHGDMNMVRVSAIAKRFDADVVAYIQSRKKYEGKEIKLFQYEVAPNGEMRFKLV